MSIEIKQPPSKHFTYPDQYEDLDHSNAKNTSTLASLASENSPEKALLTQTFYQYHHHHGCFQSHSLIITPDHLILKRPETLTIAFSDLLGATLKLNYSLKNYKGDLSLHCLKLHILAKVHMKGIHQTSHAIYKREYKVYRQS